MVRITIIKLLYVVAIASTYTYNFHIQIPLFCLTKILHNIFIAHKTTQKTQKMQKNSLLGNKNFVYSQTYSTFATDFVSEQRGVVEIVL